MQTVYNAPSLAKYSCVAHIWHVCNKYRIPRLMWAHTGLSPQVAAIHFTHTTPVLVFFQLVSYICPASVFSSTCVYMFTMTFKHTKAWKCQAYAKQTRHISGRAQHIYKCWFPYVNSIARIPFHCMVCFSQVWNMAKNIVDSRDVWALLHQKLSGIQKTRIMPWTRLTLVIASNVWALGICARPAFSLQTHASTHSFPCTLTESQTLLLSESSDQICMSNATATRQAWSSLFEPASMWMDGYTGVNKSSYASTHANKHTFLNCKM
jgi:hypothetical protein